MSDDGSSKLVRMEESAYKSESVLQKLLADYPDLLAGDQIDPSSPRKWLLVSREFGIADDEDTGNRWSLDHFFLDQDAIPTLVEVKRSKDPRIRRDVIGQMLDYAANAVAYSPVEKVRERFEATCKAANLDPGAEILRVVESEERAAGFWQSVENNLKTGRIRLVFVADTIPRELQRVVEFLNEQMNPAEVLAVEIKQFTGGGKTTLVPRVYGNTSEAEAKKRPSGVVTRQWDEESFFDALTRVRGPKEAEVAREILGWARNNHFQVYWGRGAVEGGYTLYLEDDRGTHNSVKVMNTGKVEVSTVHMRGQPPFDAEPLRVELLKLVNRIPGVSIPLNKTSGYPTFPLAALAEPQARQLFFDALKWFITQVKSQPAAAGTAG